MSHESVEFGGTRVAAYGIAAGAAIATVPSYFAIVHLGMASSWLAGTIVVAAVVMGGLVAGVSAFFGIVIPSRVHEEDKASE